MFFKGFLKFFALEYRFEALKCTLQVLINTASLKLMNRASMEQVHRAKSIFLRSIKNLKLKGKIKKNTKFFMLSEHSIQITLLVLGIPEQGLEQELGCW